MPDAFPTLRSVVLDATDARGLAEFYRQLLGYAYLPGSEPPPAGQPDPDADDWLVLLHPSGFRIAIQHVDELPRSTWPTTEVPQQLHLDLQVHSMEELHRFQAVAVAAGATVLEDRSADDEEPLFVMADPAGHPFCLFVVGAPS